MKLTTTLFGGYGKRGCRMSEIEKLYENAGIRYFDINACKIDETGKNGKCNIYKYPPFTAEKQLAVEKAILLNIGGHPYRKISYYITRDGSYTITYDADATDANIPPYITWGQDRAEILASLLNFIWQDLTDTEKGEIRRILE